MARQVLQATIEKAILENPKATNSEIATKWKSVSVQRVSAIRISLQKNMQEATSVLTSLNNTYSNVCGSMKQLARDKMIKACIEQGVIPTLPYKTCELEKQFLAKKGKGYEFIGCEKDLDTFKDMVTTITESTTLRKAITPFYGEIGNILNKASQDEFANLILDYCGILDTFKDEIANVIANDIVKVNGAICITLSKMGIGNKNGIIGEIMNQFPKGMFGDTMGDTELGTKLFINKILNEKYVVEEFFNYQDDKKDENGQPILKKNGQPKKNMPMMLIIIRRIK